MHRFQSHGIEYHYNGDYSGLILVIMPTGYEYEATFNEIIALSDLKGTNFAPILASRAFVSDAVRRTLISSLEQMDTEDILTLPEALKMYQEVRDNHSNKGE